MLAAFGGHSGDHDIGVIQSGGRWVPSGGTPESMAQPGAVTKNAVSKKKLLSYASNLTRPQREVKNNQKK